MPSMRSTEFKLDRDTFALHSEEDKSKPPSSASKFDQSSNLNDKDLSLLFKLPDSKKLLEFKTKVEFHA